MQARKDDGDLKDGAPSHVVFCSRDHANCPADSGRLGGAEGKAVLCYAMLYCAAEYSSSSFRSRLKADIGPSDKEARNNQVR